MDDPTEPPVSVPKNRQGRVRLAGLSPPASPPETGDRSHANFGQERAVHRDEYREVLSRLDVIDERFQWVDKRFGGAGERLNRMGERFDPPDQRPKDPSIPSSSITILSIGQVAFQ